MTKEPVLIAAAVAAVLNALVALHTFTLSTDQLSVVNIAVVAVLALFVRSQVTPVNKV